MLDLVLVKIGFIALGGILSVWGGIVAYTSSSNQIPEAFWKNWHGGLPMCLFGLWLIFFAVFHMH